MTKRWISRLLVLGLVLSLTSCQAFQGHRHAAVDSHDPVLSKEAGMAIIGEAENVTILPQGFTYKARIDTGATTTSIHALDIKQIERDGKKAVRFSLVDPKTEEKVAVTLPLVRVASIRRHGAEDQERMVVRLQMTLGEVKDTIEFTLTDRSKYTYPVLVGRNLLADRFLVDVSQSFVADAQ